MIIDNRSKLRTPPKGVAPPPKSKFFQVIIDYLLELLGLAIFLLTVLLLVEEYQALYPGAAYPGHCINQYNTTVNCPISMGGLPDIRINLSQYNNSFARWLENATNGGNQYEARKP